MILPSEELYRYPVATYSKVLEFLDLPDWKLEHYEIYNSGHYKNEKMSPSTRKALVDYFKPHNLKLYNYLGKTFDWDK